MNPRTNHPSAPTWLRWVTRLSLVFGLVAFVLMIWTVGIDTLVDQLRAIGPWFGLLLAIDATAAMCDAGAIYLMTRGPGAPSLRDVCVAQLAGRAVNSVTPGANVGEALKVSLLARTCSTQRIVAAVMFVALAGVVVSLVVVAVGSGVTALVFELPDSARFALAATGVCAAAAAVAVIVFVRRGVLGTLTRAARRVRLISDARCERWERPARELDRRLRGELQADHRLAAAGLVVISQLLQRGVVWIAIIASGYSLGTPQLIVVLSAGVVLGWLSTIVPLGVGVAEGGNYTLFALINAPASLGVALALARRVNQIVFAAFGFAVLAVDRLAHTVNETVIDEVSPVDATVIAP